MNEIRDSKIDAALSGAVVLGSLAVLVGNVLTRLGSGPLTGRWVIVYGLLLGTAGAAALSARVFWRHRIGLAAWLLMFGVHATAMALATQAFNWMRKSDAAVAEPAGREIGINALLLTVALLTALLVRGAVLLAAAKNMPGWLAIRNENESAIPRLWLFALYWISPLAWWAGVLCTVNIFSSSDAGAWSTAGLLLCVAIATVRVAVRFVLFEKNKYTNWRRSPQGRAKFRAALNSAGFVLSGFITFYAYFFMAARAQDDALASVLKKNAAARLAEIKAMQPPGLPAKENAEVIYRLARQSVIPVNWTWAEKNWDTAPARTEVARNLTALSYLRQASAVPGIDFGLDWSDDTRRTWPAAWVSAGLELDRIAQLEGRQAAAKNEWTIAVENFRACLGFARHQSRLPHCGAVSGPDMALDFEQTSALIFAAALLQPEANPSDAILLEIQNILREHFDVRGDFANRQVYFSALITAHLQAESYRNENAWPGKADIYTMLRKLAFIDWARESQTEADLALIKLTTFQRMDRNDTNALVQRSQLAGSLPYHNIYALEALRLLEAAVGVKRYQRYHAAWPNTLAECVPQFMPAIPGDPNARGRFIQYEPSPPRVYSIGKALSHTPEKHGFPDENYFQGYALKIKESESGNRILFLAN